MFILLWNLAQEAGIFTHPPVATCYGWPPYVMMERWYDLWMTPPLCMGETPC